MHPAVFLLLPPSTPAPKPTLMYDKRNDYHIVSLTADATAGDKPMQLARRLVVYGLADE